MTGGSYDYDEMREGGKREMMTMTKREAGDDGGASSGASSTAASSSFTTASTTSDSSTLPPSSLFRRLTTRLDTLYSNLSPHEISGSCGDLGTFIPLVVSMARTRSIALSPALFFAGLSNILTGITWDVPMPVQPMKSIAAVAISEVWSLQETTTAGILTGGLILVIGTTYLIELINVIVPLPVVTGIQVGVGLRLMGKGMVDVSQLPWVGSGDSILLAVVVSVFAMYWLREPRPSQRKGRDEDESKNDEGEEGRGRDDGGESTAIASSGGESSDRTYAMPPIDEEDGEQLDGDNVERPEHSATTPGLRRRRGRILESNKSGWWQRFRRCACCCIPSLSGTSRKDDDLPPHPVGVYLFLTGCIFAAVELATTDNADGRYDLPLRFFGAPVAIWALDGATASDWKVGFLEGAVPQIPLTTLNSVISVCALATALYPEKRKKKKKKKKKKGRRSRKGKGDGGDGTRCCANGGCCGGSRRRRGVGAESDDGGGRSDDGDDDDDGEVVSRREVSVSVGLMNIITCPFGGMPNCHGAGGLAGQHRFGARTGSSVCFLGVNKVLLAVFLGASALTLLDAFPAAILGVMLAIAGGELCTTGLTLLVDRSNAQSREAEVGIANGEERRKIGKRVLRQNTLIAIVTTSVIVALRRTDYGVLAGWVTHMIYGDGTHQLLSWIRRRRRRGRDAGCYGGRRGLARRRSTSVSQEQQAVGEGGRPQDGGPIGANEDGDRVLDNGELHVKCTSSIIGSLRRNDDFKGVA